MDELRKQNREKEEKIKEKARKVIKGKNRIKIVDEANMTEEEKKKLKEEKINRISQQINKFWEKNAGLLEEENSPNKENEDNKNKKNKIYNIICRYQ